ncbi:GntR family transcriptional regulator [Rhodococcus wratislaviensis]|uniref:GntR family transcriptional regulator n=1 Tax=Rhodococcus wratislaviensis TaxID=44752 RepID=UPI0009DCA591|nr:GntR family transcriptional regulator [Rhodococcus wratislaviensis]
MRSGVQPTKRIRDRIVLGVLQPGEKLSVYSLADELGVSRVPLREAVRQLEAESHVDNVPRRGTVVRLLRCTVAEAQRRRARQLPERDVGTR